MGIIPDKKGGMDIVSMVIAFLVQFAENHGHPFDWLRAGDARATTLIHLLQVIFFVQPQFFGKFPVSYRRQ